jgi:peptidoglycan glycosyltransferase
MLPPSCDTGFAMLGGALDGQNLADEAASFGFFSRPPIDLPTDQYSVSTLCQDVGGCQTPTQAALYLEGDLPFLAYSAIGQGNVAATPLEMALVASGIADDGVIMKPHVMGSILDHNDNVVDTYQPTSWLRATSPKTAQAITGLMEKVVSQAPAPGVLAGTAYGIFPASWQVAAKTGTAQVGTGNTATTDWMIAFAPASHPQVAIAVIVPDQSLSASGASVSGPIVHTMLCGIFDCAA